MQQALLTIRDRLDRTGIILSGMCALHCVLSIVAVSALGLGSQALFAPWVHRVGLGLALVIGVFTLAYGAVRHSRFDNLGIGAVGLGMMGAALFVEHGPGEAVMTIAGVSLVAYAHFRNLRVT